RNREPPARNRSGARAVSRGNNPARNGGTVVHGNRRGRGRGDRDGDVAPLKGPRDPHRGTPSGQTARRRLVQEREIMAACPDQMTLLGALLDGELDAANTALVEAHIAR